MAEMQIVCYQSKKVKICRVFYFLQLLYVLYIYYIYLKRYFENFVTNDFLSIFWRTAALKVYD